MKEKENWISSCLFPCVMEVHKSWILVIHMFERAAAISSSKLREHLRVKYDAISTQHPDNVVMISHKKIAPAEWTFVMDVALLRVGDCYLSKKKKTRKEKKKKKKTVMWNSPVTNGKRCAGRMIPQVISRHFIATAWPRVSFLRIFSSCKRVLTDIAVILKRYVARIIIAWLTRSLMNYIHVRDRCESLAFRSDERPEWVYWKFYLASPILSLWRTRKRAAG